MNKKRLVSLLLSAVISASGLATVVSSSADGNSGLAIDSTKYTSSIDKTVTRVVPKSGKEGNKFLTVSDRNSKEKTTIMLEKYDKNKLFSNAKSVNKT